MKVIDQCEGKNWVIYNGDCCEVMKGLPDNSVDMSMFSPPFSSLYVYSNSDRDLGNTTNDESFVEHFKFMIKEMFRVIKPGRIVAVHCMDLPAMKFKDGYIGLKDFPGKIISAFEDAGFIYHARITIWKKPSVEFARTHAIGLAKWAFIKDSTTCRNTLPDYIVAFRKPGENQELVAQPENVEGNYLWEYCADTIWFDPYWLNINQSNVLQNKRKARDSEDERHIAPLQISVAERCITLWSNPDDVVLSPFSGIGTEVYVAVKEGRKGIGIELKPSYYKISCENLKEVKAGKHDSKQMDLFDFGENYRVN
jgi:DNA modification methylase